MIRMPSAITLLVATAVPVTMASQEMASIAVSIYKRYTITLIDKAIMSLWWFPAYIQRRCFSVASGVFLYTSCACFQFQEV